MWIGVKNTMQDRELHKLSRTDLLELLLQLRKENEELKARLAETEAALSDRTLRIDEAGSIAEAALQLNGVFEAAQESCQHYIDNIMLLSTRQEEICRKMEQETKAKCDRMLADAELRSKVIMDCCSTKLRELLEESGDVRQTLLKNDERKNDARRIDPTLKSL